MLNEVAFGSNTGRAALPRIVAHSAKNLKIIRVKFRRKTTSSPGVECTHDPRGAVTVQKRDTVRQNCKTSTSADDGNRFRLFSTFKD